MNLLDRFDTHLGLLAALCCLLALFAFGAAIGGYSHIDHPVALLGARGMPRALAFNLLVFVVPGLLAAVVSLRLRARLPAQSGWMGWAGGIGATLLLLSALAFAAQGLLPLDPADLDGPVSQWHAASWTLWWIAFVPAAGLLALALWRQDRWRRLARTAVVAAVLALVLTTVSGVLLPGPLAQRALLVMWWCALVVASRSR
jgi:hypothetical membrane protein